MKEVILDRTLAVGTFTSNPFSVDESTTALGLYIKYTKGTETQLQLTVVHQDQVEDDWYDVSEISGGPGTNPVLAYDYIFTASQTIVIPMQITLRGDYRVDGIVTGAADGTLELYIAEVKY